VGDVVLSLPALHALRRSLPGAELAVQCRPALTELYQGQPGVERVLACDDQGIGASLAVAERLRREQFDLAVLFPNAFRAA
jgi:ADP-heptose:LPS heptosyltransferase